MNLALIVQAVCSHLSRSSTYPNPLGPPSPADGVGPNRHSREYLRKQCEMATDNVMPLTYEHAIGAHVQRYRELLSTPIPWTTPSLDGPNQWSHEERERELSSIRLAIIEITHQHAPDALYNLAPDLLTKQQQTVAENNITNNLTSSSPTVEVPLDGGESSACNHIMYEHSLNASYHRHHTIGMNTGSPPRQRHTQQPSTHDDEQQPSGCHTPDHHHQLRGGREPAELVTPPTACVRHDDG